jgi:hypothetical protein
MAYIGIKSAVEGISWQIRTQVSFGIVDIQSNSFFDRSGELPKTEDGV